MEIQAKLLHKLDLVTGTSTKGESKKKDLVFETTETYPKKIAISFWNDLINQVNDLNIGDSCTISINVESREYNGKWFTEVKAWKLTVISKAIIQHVPSSQLEDLNKNDTGLPF